MKINIIIMSLLGLLFFTACGENGSEPYVVPVTYSEIDSSVSSEYQIYTEKTLSQRSVSFELFNEVSNAETLSGSQLNSLHIMLENYYQNLDTKNEYIHKYQYLLGNSDEYSPEDRLKLVMISLSAMLMSYDDYLLVYAQYYDDDKLRGVLNNADSAYGIPEGTLETMKEQYLLESDREVLEDMMIYYDANKEKYGTAEDSFFLYLKQLIEDSATYQFGFYESSILDDILNALEDTGASFFSSIFSGLSSNIGNTAGLVEVRKGKLYDNPMVTETVKSTLKAGDLLLEKTPFRLTDKLIPGYYGHIAVYIGTQEQLEELGIWDDPIVVAHKDEIIGGKVIAEALRDGVQLNSVEHFLNIDDLVVMYDTVETLQEKRDRIILTLKQLGKEYDYEYDVEDNTKIICSELVYVTYLSVEWETEVVIGVETISPDNVVVKALEPNSIFTIPLMYHDGEEVFEDKVELIQNLLDSEE